MRASLVLSLLALFGAQPRTVLAQAKSNWREQGQAIVAEAFSVLSTNLTQAMTAGGPSQAIRLCSEEALPLTARIAQTNHVQLRRVSHRARNPKNQASPTERSVLDEFAAALSSGRKPQPIVQEGSNGGATFFAPIVIQLPVCLNCHGDPAREILPSTTQLLRELYPQDNATGFKLGDLRGMWRVDFPSAPRSTTP